MRGIGTCSLPVPVTSVKPVDDEMLLTFTNTYAVSYDAFLSHASLVLRTDLSGMMAYNRNHTMGQT